MQEAFSVPDVHCEHCDRAITRAVTELDGVASTKVDLEAKSVTVEYDANQVGRDAIVAAIEEEGYPVGRSAAGGLSVGFGPSNDN